MKSILKLLIFISVFHFASAISAQETQPADSLKNEPKESDRNVMLNAANANGPRQISIGLPSEDVSVYENGLPAVYSSAIQGLSTHWRADASMKKVGLMEINETAIATGNIAYAVNSFSNTGTKDFQGVFNYNTNHFGLQRFDLGLSGSFNKDWMYAASIYQNFDPGSFKLRFTNYWDRTQLYKAAINRKLGDKGSISLQYKYSNSRRLEQITEMAPFIYVGDGSVQEVPGFSLGTSSYSPIGGRYTTMDMRNGRVSDVGLNDACQNRANELMLNMDYTFNNGLEWKFDAKVMKSHNSYVWVGAPAINKVTDGIVEGTENDPEANIWYINGTDNKFTGMKQNRIASFHYGDIKSAMITSELYKAISKHNVRLGLNEWYYKAKYWSNTIRFDHDVTEYPTLLSHAENGNQVVNYAMNHGGNEYYDGNENKLALYMTDNWDVTNKLNIYLGARAEYYRYRGKNLPYARFDNFYLGAKDPDTGVTVEPVDFKGDYFNYALAATATYHINDHLGVMADGTMVTRRPRLEDYATPDYPSTAQTQIKLGRAGIFYNNDWINLTSLVSYIGKTNNRTVVNISHPNPGNSETMASAFNYDIKTIGWTTDAIIRPFKDFNLHFLFTYQKPKYEKFETTVTFSDGMSKSINATGNNVTEIPEILIEIDPSYTIAKKINIWTSFRYFSKTYANLSNALYFNGHWETFGGVTYKINDMLTIGATAINFLNQTGATGTIAGSELIQKDEASKFKNTWMAGKYIRPFTMEFSASIKF